MLDLKTSQQRRPIASLRFMPVMSSAARLNEVIFQSRSTVKTPSEMLSRIDAVRLAWQFRNAEGCRASHCGFFFDF
jgi:hypothetical protein